MIVSSLSPTKSAASKERPIAVLNSPFQSLRDMSDEHWIRDLCTASGANKERQLTASAVSGT